MGNIIGYRRKPPTPRQKEENIRQEFLTEKFLAEISKKIGSNWILICVSLGVPSYILDQIKIDANLDVPTKIYEGLRRWRELNGRKTDGELIAELKDALADNGRQDLVEEVDNFLKQSRKERGKNENTDYYSKETEDTEAKDLKEKLLKLNMYKTQKVPISPLQITSKMPIEDIFAPLTIREDLEYKGKGKNIGMKNKQTKPVNCPEDMLYIDGDMARSIFMLGDAGIGKSVFCLRMVENWCKAHKLSPGDTISTGRDDGSRLWVSALKQFDFLFCVQLRHVNKSRSSVIDMVVNDVFQVHPTCREVIRRVLFSESYRCLIVIDGIDEWKVSDEVRSELNIEGLPNTECISNCTFLWTMRPWVMYKFSEMINGSDRVVEIQGLDTNSIDIVIEKMLINFYDLERKSLLYKEKEKFIKEKSQGENLESILQIPLMAIACIQIWYEEKNAGNSMTSLYVALIDLLIRRSNKKSPLPDKIKEKLATESVKVTNEQQCLLRNKNIKEFMSVIIKLGRIAYDDLVSNETHLVFRIEDLENHLEEYELDIAVKTGILSKCEAPGICHEENVSINFFHKSIQEFLAAIYIENHGEMHEFYQHLSSIEDIMELGNVLIFLSGLNPMLGSSISKHIVDVANVDTEICEYRKFRDAFLYINNKVELLYKLQVNCFREITYSNSCSNDSQHVPYHVSDIQVDDYNSTETIRATADILTHHHDDISSLYLNDVPTDTEYGIPDSILPQYLDHTVSLQSLWINEYNTNRVLHHISDIFSSLTALLLYGITLSSDAISTLQSALQSNTVIQTLGLVGIECKVNKYQGHERASLSGIIRILPDLPRLSALHIQLIHDDDKPILRDVLNRLSHLHGMVYIGSYPDDVGSDRDVECDRDVVQTLCTWSGLRWLYLALVDLGDSRLQLSHDMSHLEHVLLDKVKMSPSGWRYFIQSVLNIKHTFYVYLRDMHIDKESKSMIRSSPELEITRDSKNKDGRNYIKFTRVWPRSQQGRE